MCLAVFINWWAIFGSPYPEDYSILGSVFGPLFMETLYGTDEVIHGLPRGSNVVPFWVICYKPYANK